MMKTSSAKGKGRRLQNFVAEQIQVGFSNKYPSEHIVHGDIKPAIMGETGADIKFSPFAKRLIPYDIECKNQENWSIPSWWKQTTANTEEGRKPLLVIKKNRHEPLVVMRFSDWMELI